MSEKKESLNFLEQIIAADLKNGFPKEKLRFRFPPEPNGYLHIGHTKAIGISFGLGLKYQAPVNLRFDDTNPAKEEQEYVDAIKRDIKWLGYSWANELYSSDYFQQLYDWAILMIQDGFAYVDSQSSEQIAEQKGTPTQPGVNSPFRDRSVTENLELFKKMKSGEFAEGTHVLRAKIDMADPNMLMRDPIMYRIINKPHHRTGTKWCIYPMYDWAHGECDYVEQVSHSLCSLEFKPHRKLYNWFRDIVYTYSKDKLPLKPKQREFARLNLSYTIMSKRKLLQLVEQNIVSGWDDPRMPTVSGLRRRGYTPASIRNFIERVGVAKRDNVIDVSLLEFSVREDLNKVAQRAMAVLNPVKLVITNYPKDKTEEVLFEINPEDPNAGTRKIPFSRELYIEREDFKEEATGSFFRLSLGSEVRLKGAYIIKATGLEKDASGAIIQINCTYDPASLSGSGTPASLRKVKGTLHWVSASHANKAEIRVYDRLFLEEAPDGHKDKDFMEFLNPNSLLISEGFIEPFLSKATPGDTFQFQRLGYFRVDEDSTSQQIVFNKTVGLRDTWTKKKPKQNPSTSSSQNTTNTHQRPAIEEIKKLGKKYTNLPEEKQLKTRAEIIKLAEKVAYDDLSPLFNTTAKKVGTRIAVALTLGVMLKNGQEKTAEAQEFIEKALADSNQILAQEAKNLV
jgi:glutaminyl-tRNA synthetase